MTDDRGEAGPAPAGPLRPDDPVPAVRTAAAGGPSGLAIFVGLAVLGIVSFGAPALMLGGATRLPDATPLPTPGAIAAAAARTAATAATAAAGRVRVASATGRSTPLTTGGYQVTFQWSLVGAREGDAAVVTFSAGNRSLGERRGPLDASVFSFASGTFTLMAALECSTGGWTAEILTIRGEPVDGDSEAKVPGVACR